MTFVIELDEKDILDLLVKLQDTSISLNNYVKIVKIEEAENNAKKDGRKSKLTPEEMIEKRNAYAKQYREKNKDKHEHNKEKMREYYAKNREKLLESKKLYREANLEKIRQRDRDRYARLKAEKNK